MAHLLRGRRAALLGAVVAVGGAASFGISTTALFADTRTATTKGSVSVLYAGSLEDSMEKSLGPGFQRSTGFGFEGFGGGSNELAAEIKGGVRRGDVFISASPSADTELAGSENGSWTSWYSTFATSPLELGYDPSTTLGKELAKGVPWYKAITRKGALVGRTDPKLDPKGKLTVEAVDAAASKLNDSQLKHVLKGVPVYPETDLVGRLQSGQLEAGFFYEIEAKVAKFPAVSLAPVKKYAEYTITLLNRASNRAGGEALVSYLLEAKRSAVLGKTGLKPVKPRFHGRSSSVPNSLRSVVGAK